VALDGKALRRALDQGQTGKVVVSACPDFRKRHRNGEHGEVLNAQYAHQNRRRLREKLLRSQS